jgi:hypothetical protein
LLEPVEQGYDHTVFGVPDDVLTLRAITIAAGRSEIKHLAATYRRIGGAVAEAASHYPIPELTIDDLAVDRADGTPVFVPPVRFGEGTQDFTIHEEEFSASFAEELDGRLRQATAAVLLGEFREGLVHGTGPR